ncbi:MAG: hypothetical protein ACK559_05625, partial [bacterium]
ARAMRAASLVLRVVGGSGGVVRAGRLLGVAAAAGSPRPSSSTLLASTGRNLNSIAMDSAGLQPPNSPRSCSAKRLRWPHRVVAPVGPRRLQGPAGVSRAGAACKRSSGAAAAVSGLGLGGKTWGDAIQLRWSLPK